MDEMRDDMVVVKPHRNTAAIRIHTLAKSIGVTKARVVGHDIGLMVAYAYAAQFSDEVEKLVVMDAFLPGVAVCLQNRRFRGAGGNNVQSGRELPTPAQTDQRCP